MSERKQYVILPAYGFEGPVLSQAIRPNTFGPVRLKSSDGRVSEAATTMHVLESIGDDAPKLVEMTEQAELNLRVEHPGLKIIPVVTYRKMRFQPGVREFRPAAATVQVSGSATVQVVDQVDGRPLQGAKIVAFTNFQRRVGDEATTDAQGRAVLKLADGTRLERLYVFGPSRYWGFFAKGITLSDEMKLPVRAIDLNVAASLVQRLYGSLPTDAGRGVTVAVVDTGVALNHPALPGIEGVNLVQEETAGDPGASVDFGPAANGGEHSTHVAGIVGARPSPAFPLRGVAPGATIRSYRVFPNTGKGATNFDIMNAIDRAVKDNCDIINLSLGGGSEDEGVRAAIGKALDHGVLVVAAAGNDSRKAVSFPAAFMPCVGVSAMGQKGSFPDDSSEASDVDKPFGDPDKTCFIAGFSNFGPQIDLTGPGVGIVSTLPDDTYGVMSGTSMACPAVAGVAAHLLSSQPAIQAKTGTERAEALKEALARSAASKGFGRQFEGFGLPERL